MRNLYLSIIAILLIGTFNACSKKEAYEKSTNTNVQYLTLRFNASYADFQVSPIGKQAGVAKTTSSKKEVMDLQNGFFGEFQVEEKNRISTTTVGGLRSSLQKLGSTDKEGITTSGTFDEARFTKLDKGVKFMVLIFDDQDNHIGTQLVTMGEGAETPIKVSFREEYELINDNPYRIVAFTYNTKNEDDFSDALINLDPDNTHNNPQIVIPTDKEFFYYNSDLPIDQNFTSPIISIKFIPLTAKVGITVDSRGLGGQLKELQGVFKNFPIKSTYHFDLKLNKVASTVTVPSGSPAFGDFPFSFNGLADTVTVARYVYFPNATDQEVLSKLTVELSKLVIQKGEPGSAEEISLIKTGSLLTSIFENLTLKTGKFFNGRLNLYGGFQTRNIIWASANLYYDESDPDQQYKFRSSPAEGRGEDFELTDYWRPYSWTPNGESYQESLPKIDPCTRALPSGWRLPTEDEVGYMINDHFKGEDISQEYVEVSTTDARLNYMEYRKKYNEGSQKLRFYGAGYYMKDKLEAYIKTTVSALFLTSDVTLIGKDYYTLAFTLYPRAILTDGFTDAVTPYSNSATLYNHRFNIRCVRDVR